MTLNLNLIEKNGGKNVEILFMNMMLYIIYYYYYYYYYHVYIFVRMGKDFAYKRLICKVTRLGGENSQFQYNRASSHT
jgi:hypothetical protein